MILGENNRDLTAEERKAGQKAARTLKRHLKTLLATSTTRQTGDALSMAKVTTRMKFDMLDHLAIESPHYIFKQHYGFEGIKSNGVRMRLPQYDHFNKLLDGNRAIEKLADEIGAIRAEQITSKINF